MRCVYFIRRADGAGPIKIGCTSGLVGRVAQLSSDYRAEMKVLASAPGDFLDERNVLLKFSQHNVDFTDSRGKKVCEWFAPAPDLLAFIAKVKRTGIIPLTMKDRRELQMRDLYLEGATLEEIGGRFDITRERVRQILRRTGVPSLGHRPEICRSVVTLEIEAEIVRLASEGKTQPEIADALSIDRHNVSLYLRRNGVSAPRASKGCSPETLATARAVAAEYAAGISTKEIAERHHTWQPTIYRYLRIAGAKPDRVGRSDVELPLPEVIAAYRGGATIQGLAARYQRSANSIRSCLAKAGALRSRQENEAIRIARVSAANLRRRAA